MPARDFDPLLAASTIASLDRLLEGCQIVDRDLRWVYANAAAATQGSRTPEELVGRHIAEVYPGVERSPLYAAIVEVLTKGGSQRFDTEFHFPDGSSKWFQMSLEAVPAGVFILSVDITSRIETERELRRSEARHRALLDGLPDQVFRVDADGKVVDLHMPDGTVSLRATAMHEGVPLDAMLPSAAAGPLREALVRARETRAILSVTYEVPHADGVRHFEARVVPGEEGGCTVIATDVTVRRNLEAQLRQSQKMEAVGQLTGGIAHDLNNILTVIGSNTELLQQSDPEDAALVGGLEEISHATRRGAEMISSLLRFSRRGMLTRVTQSVVPVVRDFATMARRLLPESVTIHVGEMPDVDAVSLDAGALEQVLANLCTNARDAMPHGGNLRFEARSTWLDSGYHATHPWVVPGAYVCISVTDDGAGMDEATRMRVFEPFFTTKPVGAGTGLGLSMVYGLMKAHDGMVHVYSEPGRGTEVKLYFPVADSTSVPMPRRRQSDPGLVRRGTETILLVEDDVAIRRATRRALEAQGYTVLEAGDGEEGLSMMRGEAAGVALIVSDLVMPRLGGRQMADALAAAGIRVPVLFTSAYSEDQLYRSADLSPDVRFLHKPWTLADLFRMVRLVIDEAEASGGA